MMVLMGEDSVETMEFRLLAVREEALDARRNEVRMLPGEKRAVMEWKRECCILASSDGRRKVIVVVIRVGLVGLAVIWQAGQVRDLRIDD